MTTQLVTLQYNDQISVNFTSDAWFNATTVAKQYNKRPNDWLSLESTKEYIKCLHAALFPEIQLPEKMVIKQNQLLKTKTGSEENGGGSWFHPKLAVAFARWLDVKFSVWCDMQIDKLLMPKPTTAPSTLTTEMERHVQEMVNALKHKTGKVHNTIYHELKTHFKVSSYTEIPIVKYAEVCAYFGEKPIYTAPELIQCDSRYLGELEKKAATLLELEQRKTAFVEISDEQVVIERQRFNELEFIAKCVTEPQSRFMSIMRRFDKTNLSDMATLLESMCHATPIKPKNG